MRYVSILLLSMTLNLCIYAETPHERKERHLQYAADALTKTLEASERKKICEFVCASEFGGNQSAFWFAMANRGIKTGNRQVMDKSTSEYCACESEIDSVSDADNMPHTTYKTTSRIAMETTVTGVWTFVSLYLLKNIIFK